MLVVGRDMLVVLVCLVAMVTDGRWHRIPNWLTFPAIGLGLLVNAVDAGVSGLGRSLAGLGMALLLTVPLFVAGMLKAGDVKLVAAWGALKGVGAPVGQSFALWAFLYGAVIGGAVALVIVVRGRALRALAQRLRTALAAFGFGAPVPMGGTESAATTVLRAPFPYGVALCWGALLALACERLWGQPFPLWSF